MFTKCGKLFIVGRGPKPQAVPKKILIRDKQLTNI